MNILGVRYGHDSGAALVVDGKVVANVSEERLTRIKHDTSFPIRSIALCLELAGINSEEIDCLAIPSNSIPEAFFTFFSIPQSIVPTGVISIKGKIEGYMKKGLRIAEPNVPILPLYQKPLVLSPKCRIHLCEHHRAHAASAYYSSGLAGEKALIVTMDGIGENVAVAFWKGEKESISSLMKMDGGASLGYFYSNATEAMGWRHGSGEWKVMGLAPYGTPQPDALKGYYPEFENGKLVKPRIYGSFGRWNDHGANHYHGRDAAPLETFVKKLGRENFAAEAQRVVEEEAFKLILPWIKKEKTRHLCCAGGFFLNVKFNQKLWYTGELDTQWVYPDCGDSGLPVGAAFDAYYSKYEAQPIERMSHLYFGPEFSNDEIKQILDDRCLSYQYTTNPAKDTAKYLSDNRVVGWFQGRMESGPRALGNRSILMSPLNANNKDIINAKVKYREKFRPFCPSLLYERRDDYLVSARDEFFMVTSFDVKENKKDKIPAVVHVDGTARPQMVRKEVNPLYHQLIDEFEKITGEGIILNTSFNIRGEPIVCNPREAIRCFYDTGLDVLVLGNYIIEKPMLKNNNVE